MAVHIFVVLLATNLIKYMLKPKHLEQILSGKALDSKEITAEDKKCLYAAFGEYGMPLSTAYLRLFVKGFKPWEICGVTQLCKDFLANTPVCTGQDDADPDSHCGRGYRLTLDRDYNDAMFYGIVCDLKLCTRLSDFMAGHGMASATTVRLRFKEGKWLPWELVGVKHILSQFSSAVCPADNGCSK